MHARVRKDFLTALRCKEYFQRETELETLMNQVHGEKHYDRLSYEHLEIAWKHLSISKNELITLQNTLNTSGIDAAICATFMKMLDELQGKKVSLEGLRDLTKESLKVTISEQFVRFIELSVIALTSHISLLSGESTSSIVTAIIVLCVASIGVNMKVKRKA